MVFYFEKMDAADADPGLSVLKIGFIKFITNHIHHLTNRYIRFESPSPTYL